MPERTRIIIPLAALLLLTALAVAAAAPGVTPQDRQAIMPVSEVRAGMKGYGLTVFQGTWSLLS